MHAASAQACLLLNKSKSLQLRTIFDTQWRLFPYLAELQALPGEYPLWFLQLHVLIDALQIIALALVPYHAWGSAMDVVSRGLSVSHLPLYDTLHAGYSACFAVVVVLTALLCVQVCWSLYRCAHMNGYIAGTSAFESVPFRCKRAFVYLITGPCFVPVLQNMLAMLALREVTGTANNVKTNTGLGGGSSSSNNSNMSGNNSSPGGGLGGESSAVTVLSLHWFADHALHEAMPLAGFVLACVGVVLLVVVTYVMNTHCVDHHVRSRHPLSRCNTYMDAAYLAYRFVSCVLLHTLHARDAMLAYAVWQCAASLFLAVSYALVLPYYHESMNKLRIAVLYLAALYALLAAVTHVPAVASTLPGARAQPDVIVVAVLAVVVWPVLYVFVALRLRVSAVYTRALAGLRRGELLLPVVHLPKNLQRDTEYGLYASNLLDRIESTILSESDSQASDDEDEFCDEVAAHVLRFTYEERTSYAVLRDVANARFRLGRCIAPYVDYVVLHSDAEVATRFARYFADVAQMPLSGYQLRYAATIYLKAIARFVDCAQTRLGFALFLLYHVRNASMAYDVLREMGDSDPPTWLSFQLWRVHVAVSDALHLGMNNRVAACNQTKDSHRDVLRATTEFWKLLARHDISYERLAHTHRTLVHAQQATRVQYERLLLDDMNDLEVVACYAVFCDDVLDDTNTSNQCMQFMQHWYDVRERKRFRGTQLRAALSAAMTQLRLAVATAMKHTRQELAGSMCVRVLQPCVLVMAMLTIVALAVALVFAVLSVYYAKGGVTSVYMVGKLRTLSAKMAVAAQQVAIEQAAATRTSGATTTAAVGAGAAASTGAVDDATTHVTVATRVLLDAYKTDMLTQMNNMLFVQPRGHSYAVLNLLRDRAVRLWRDAIVLNLWSYIQVVHAALQDAVARPDEAELTGWLRSDVAREAGDALSSLITQLQSQLHGDVLMTLYVMVCVLALAAVMQLCSALTLFYGIYRVRGTQRIAFALLRLIPTSEIRALHARCLRLHLDLDVFFAQPVREKVHNLLRANNTTAAAAAAAADVTAQRFTRVASSNSMNSVNYAGGGGGNGGVMGGNDVHTQQQQQQSLLVSSPAYSHGQRASSRRHVHGGVATSSDSDGGSESDSDSDMSRRFRSSAMGASRGEKRWSHSMSLLERTAAVAAASSLTSANANASSSLTRAAMRAHRWRAPDKLTPTTPPPMTMAAANNSGVVIVPAGVGGGGNGNGNGVEQRRAREGDDYNGSSSSSCRRRPYKDGGVVGNNNNSSSSSSADNGSSSSSSSSSSESDDDDDLRSIASEIADATASATSGGAAGGGNNNTQHVHRRSLTRAQRAARARQHESEQVAFEATNAAQTYLLCQEQNTINTAIHGSTPLLFVLTFVLCTGVLGISVAALRTQESQSTYYNEVLQQYTLNHNAKMRMGFSLINVAYFLAGGTLHNFNDIVELRGKDTFGQLRTAMQPSMTNPTTAATVFRLQRISDAMNEIQAIVVRLLCASKMDICRTHRANYTQTFIANASWASEEALEMVQLASSFGIYNASFGALHDSAHDTARPASEQYDMARQIVTSDLFNEFAVKLFSVFDDLDVATSEGARATLLQLAIACLIVSALAVVGLVVGMYAAHVQQHVLTRWYLRALMVLTTLCMLATLALSCVNLRLSRRRSLDAYLARYVAFSRRWTSATFYQFWYPILYALTYRVTWAYKLYEVLRDVPPSALLDELATLGSLPLTDADRVALHTQRQLVMIATALTYNATRDDDDVAPFAYAFDDTFLTNFTWNMSAEPDYYTTLARYAQVDKSFYTTRAQDMALPRDAKLTLARDTITSIREEDAISAAFTYVQMADSFAKERVDSELRRRRTERQLYIANVALAAVAMMLTVVTFAWIFVLETLRFVAVAGNATDKKNSSSSGGATAAAATTTTTMSSAGAGGARAGGNGAAPTTATGDSTSSQQQQQQQVSSSSGGVSSPTLRPQPSASSSPPLQQQQQQSTAMYAGSGGGGTTGAVANTAATPTASSNNNNNNSGSGSGSSNSIIDSDMQHDQPHSRATVTLLPFVAYAVVFALIAVIIVLTPLLASRLNAQATLLNTATQREWLVAQEMLRVLRVAEAESNYALETRQLQTLYNDHVALTNKLYFGDSNTADGDGEDDDGTHGLVYDTGNSQNDYLFSRNAYYGTAALRQADTDAASLHSSRNLATLTGGAQSGAIRTRARDNALRDAAAGVVGDSDDSDSDGDGDDEAPFYALRGAAPLPAASLSLRQRRRLMPPMYGGGGSSSSSGSGSSDTDNLDVDPRVSVPEDYFCSTTQLSNVMTQLSRGVGLVHDVEWLGLIRRAAFSDYATTLTTIPNITALYEALGIGLARSTELQYEHALRLWRVYMTVLAVLCGVTIAAMLLTCLCVLVPYLRYLVTEATQTRQLLHTLPPHLRARYPVLTEFFTSSTAHASNDDRVKKVMIELMHSAIIVFDDRGVIVRCNEPAERLFGYTAAECVGRDIALLLPDHAAVSLAGAEFVSSASMLPYFVVAVTARRKSARLLNCTMRLVPLHLPSSHSSVYIAVFEAIGNKRKLALTEQITNASFNLNADGVLIVDAAATVVRANAAAAALFGCEVAEMVGRPLSALLLPESADYYASYFAYRATCNVYEVTSKLAAAGLNAKANDMSLSASSPTTDAPAGDSLAGAAAAAAAAANNNSSNNAAAGGGVNSSSATSAAAAATAAAGGGADGAAAAAAAKGVNDADDDSMLLVNTSQTELFTRAHSGGGTNRAVAAAASAGGGGAHPVRSVATAVRADGSAVTLRVSITELRHIPLQTQFLLFLEDARPEREAADAAALCNTLFQLSPVPVVLSDGLGRITRVSRAAVETFQCDMRDVRTGAYTLDRLLPVRSNNYNTNNSNNNNATSSSSWSSMAALLRSVDVLPAEGVRVTAARRDGTPVTCLLTATTAHHDASRRIDALAFTPTAAPAAATATTTTSAAEAAAARKQCILFLHNISRWAELERSGALLRAVLSGGAYGVVAVNARGSIRYANAAALACFGYRSERDLLGRNCNVLCAPLARSGAAAAAAAAGGGGGGGVMLSPQQQQYMHGNYYNMHDGVDEDDEELLIGHRGSSSGGGDVEDDDDPLAALAAFQPPPHYGSVTAQRPLPPQQQQQQQAASLLSTYGASSSNNTTTCVSNSGACGGGGGACVRCVDVDATCRWIRDAARAWNCSSISTISSNRSSGGGALTATLLQPYASRRVLAQRASGEVFVLELQVCELPATRHGGDGMFVLVMRDATADVALRTRCLVARALVDVCPTGVLVVDGCGNIQAASPSAARCFGFHGRDVVGANVQMLLPSLAPRTPLSLASMTAQAAAAAAAATQTTASRTSAAGSTAAASSLLLLQQQQQQQQPQRVGVVDMRGFAAGEVRTCAARARDGSMLRIEATIYPVSNSGNAGMGSSGIGSGSSNNNAAMSSGAGGGGTAQYVVYCVNVQAAQEQRHAYALYHRLYTRLPLAVLNIDRHGIVVRASAAAYDVLRVPRHGTHSRMHSQRSSNNNNKSGKSTARRSGVEDDNDDDDDDDSDEDGRDVNDDALCGRSLQQFFASTSGERYVRALQHRVAAFDEQVRSYNYSASSGAYSNSNNGNGSGSPVGGGTTTSLASAAAAFGGDATRTTPLLLRTHNGHVVTESDLASTHDNPDDDDDAYAATAMSAGAGDGGGGGADASATAVYVRMRCGDGTTSIMSCRLVEVASLRSATIHFIVYLERHDGVRAALRASRDVDALLSNCPWPLLVVDAKATTVLRVSCSAAALFGYANNNSNNNSHSNSSHYANNSSSGGSNSNNSSGTSVATTPMTAADAAAAAISNSNVNVTSSGSYSCVGGGVGGGGSPMQSLLRKPATALFASRMTPAELQQLLRTLARASADDEQMRGDDDEDEADDDDDDDDDGSSEADGHDEDGGNNDKDNTSSGVGVTMLSECDSVSVSRGGGRRARTSARVQLRRANGDVFSARLVVHSTAPNEADNNNNNSSRTAAAAAAERGGNDDDEGSAPAGLFVVYLYNVQNNSVNSSSNRNTSTSLHQQQQPLVISNNNNNSSSSSLVVSTTSSSSSRLAAHTVRMLFDSVDLPIALADYHGALVRVNGALCRAFGCPDSATLALRARHVVQLIAPHEADTHAALPHSAQTAALSQRFRAMVAMTLDKVVTRTAVTLDRTAATPLQLHTLLKAVPSASGDVRDVRYLLYCSVIRNNNSSGSSGSSGDAYATRAAAAADAATTTTSSAVALLTMDDAYGYGGNAGSEGGGGGGSSYDVASERSVTMMRSTLSRYARPRDGLPPYSAASSTTRLPLRSVLCFGGGGGSSGGGGGNNNNLRTAAAATYDDDEDVVEAYSNSNNYNNNAIIAASTTATTRRRHGGDGDNNLLVPVLSDDGGVLTAATATTTAMLTAAAAATSVQLVRHRGRRVRTLRGWLRDEHGLSFMVVAGVCPTTATTTYSEGNNSNNNAMRPRARVMHLSQTAAAMLHVDAAAVVDGDVAAVLPLVQPAHTTLVEVLAQLQRDDEAHAAALRQQQLLQQQRRQHAAQQRSHPHAAATTTAAATATAATVATGNVQVPPQRLSPSSSRVHTRVVLARRATGELVPLELHCKRVDPYMIGSDGSSHASVVDGDEGDGAHVWVVHMRDLTHEHAAARLTALCDRVVDVCAVPTLLLDASATVRVCNAAAASCFACRVDDVVGHSLDALLSAQPLSAALLRYVHAYARGHDAADNDDDEALLLPPQQQPPRQHRAAYRHRHNSNNSSTVNDDDDDDDNGSSCHGRPHWHVHAPPVRRQVVARRRNGERFAALLLLRRLCLRCVHNKSRRGGNTHSSHRSSSSSSSSHSDGDSSATASSGNSGGSSRSSSSGDECCVVAHVVDLSVQATCELTSVLGAAALHVQHAPVIAFDVAGRPLYASPAALQLLLPPRNNSNNATTTTTNATAAQLPCAHELLADTNAQQSYERFVSRLQTRLQRLRNSDDDDGRTADAMADMAHDDADVQLQLYIAQHAMYAAGAAATAAATAAAAAAATNSSNSRGSSNNNARMSTSSSLSTVLHAVQAAASAALAEACSNSSSNSNNSGGGSSSHTTSPTTPHPQQQQQSRALPTRRRSLSLSRLTDAGQLQNSMLSTLDGNNNNNNAAAAAVASRRGRRTSSLFAMRTRTNAQTRSTALRDAAAMLDDGGSSSTDNNNNNNNSRLQLTTHLRCGGAAAAGAALRRAEVAVHPIVMSNNNNNTTTMTATTTTALPPPRTMLLGTVWHVTPLAEQQRSSREVREEQRRLLESVLTHCPRALVLLDDDGYVVAVSRVFAEMLGYCTLADALAQLQGTRVDALVAEMQLPPQPLAHSRDNDSDSNDNNDTHTTRDVLCRFITSSPLLLTTTTTSATSTTTMSTPPLRRLTLTRADGRRLVVYLASFVYMSATSSSSSSSSLTAPYTRAREDSEHSSRSRSSSSSSHASVATTTRRMGHATMEAHDGCGDCGFFAGVLVSGNDVSMTYIPHLLQQLLDCCAVPAAVTNARGVLHCVNAALLDTFDHRRDTLVGETIDLLLQLHIASPHNSNSNTTTATAPATAVAAAMSPSVSASATTTNSHTRRAHGVDGGNNNSNSNISGDAEADNGGHNNSNSGGAAAGATSASSVMRRLLALESRRVMGTTRTGARIPLELTVRAVHLADTMLFVIYFTPLL